jgi:ADP-ribose pyrophosphatase YjhB (NUDIX family)
LIIKEKIIELLNQYSPTDEKELNDLRRIKRFIQNEKNWWVENNPKGHITGSTWVIDIKKKHCLLLFHAKHKCWLQLGGHIEISDNTISETALREAQEESGIFTFECIRHKIFDVDIHPVSSFRSQQRHLHYDIRFLLIAPTHTMKNISKQQSGLKWFGLEELRHITKDHSILRMAQKIMTLSSGIVGPTKKIL